MSCNCTRLGVSDPYVAMRDIRYSKCSKVQVRRLAHKKACYRLINHKSRDLYVQGRSEQYNPAPGITKTADEPSGLSHPKLPQAYKSPICGRALCAFSRDCSAVIYRLSANIGWEITTSRITFRLNAVERDVRLRTKSTGFRQ